MPAFSSDLEELPPQLAMEARHVANTFCRRLRESHATPADVVRLILGRNMFAEPTWEDAEYVVAATWATLRNGALQH